MYAGEAFYVSIATATTASTATSNTGQTPSSALWYAARPASEHCSTLHSKWSDEKAKHKARRSLWRSLLRRPSPHAFRNSAEPSSPDRAGLSAGTLRFHIAFAACKASLAACAESCRKAASKNRCLKADPGLSRRLHGVAAASAASREPPQHVLTPCKHSASNPQGHAPQDHQHHQLPEADASGHDAGKVRVRGQRLRILTRGHLRMQGTENQTGLPKAGSIIAHH